MVNIESYIQQLIDLLNKQFGSRLLYVGLQGSYLRAEATDNSDIDIMVVLDELTVSDLAHYRSLIESMEHTEKSCGFICSKSDLANWNPLEIWNLVNGTKDYFGKLRTYVPAYTEQDICNFAKLSLNNLYHEICHRYVHAVNHKSMEALAGSYKGVFYILQHLYYLQNHEFIGTKQGLLSQLKDDHHAVMERSIALCNGEQHDFDESFELLLRWCQQTLQQL